MCRERMGSVVPVDVQWEGSRRLKGHQLSIPGWRHQPRTEGWRTLQLWTSLPCSAQECAQRWLVVSVHPC